MRVHDESTLSGARHVMIDGMDASPGNLSEPKAEHHDVELGDDDDDRASVVAYASSDRDLGIAHRTLFSRRKLRALCVCMSIFIVLLAFLNVSFSTPGSSVSLSSCDDSLSPPYASSRTLGTSYCVNHPAASWVNPALIEALLPSDRITQNSISFLVVGDFGRDGFCCQRDVALEMDRAASVLGSLFVVNVGDAFYDGGIMTPTDTQVKTSFLNVYNGSTLKQSPFLSVLGEQEYRGSPSAVLALPARHRRFAMDARYYGRVVTIGNVNLQLVFLDTSPMIDSYHISGYDSVNNTILQRPDGLTSQWPQVEAQLAWLEGRLQNWKVNFDMRIVIGHHPLYSLTSHVGENRTFLQERVGPLLEKYNVTAYLSGHEHSLQFLQPGRVAHFISGAGSKTEAAFQTSDTPDDSLQFYYSEHGFLACTVYKDQLRVAVVDMSGSVIDEVVIPTNTQGR